MRDKQRGVKTVYLSTVTGKKLKQRLEDVEKGTNIHDNPPQEWQTASQPDDNEEELSEGDEDVLKDRKSSSRKPTDDFQKSADMKHTRGGVTVEVKSKSRKNRRDYPSSWGFDKGQMTMKKRVMAVFEGPRRLAKDDMMLSTDHEVRIPLADGQYVTDLDVQAMKRAQGFLDATDEEKGFWISDDPTEDDMRKMLELSG